MRSSGRNSGNRNYRGAGNDRAPALARAVEPMLGLPAGALTRPQADSS